MLGGRPLEQAVERPVDLDPIAGLPVVRLGLVGVAHFLGLRSREVAALTAGDRDEAAAQITSICGHAQNSSWAVALCRVVHENYSCG